MKRSPKPPKQNVALVSTPWPLYSRPSIQLGTLKSYLQSQSANVTVEAHHVYLNVAERLGYQLYQEIAERTWIAESIYAVLLFPERFQPIEGLFKREAGEKLVKTGLKNITALVKEATDTFLETRKWDEFLLVGFSISLCQVTSALYFIREIKCRYPSQLIVVGGSTVSGETAGDLLETFPEVDIAISGEGEFPLSQLITLLAGKPNPKSLPPIAGIVTQKTSAIKKAPIPFLQMETLDHLSPPDYDDYFNMLKTFDSSKTFIPILPVEFSRGCWWHRLTPTGKQTGCAFCNLNLQWKGYRSKKPSQMIEEIDHLTTKYKSLSVFFTDNVLPKKTSEKTFEKLADSGKDLRLFSEIRATTSCTELKTMRMAGMQEVQVGIEALSLKLLKKLNKGTTSIQNIEIMKNCETLGIVNASNLIIYFPGSDEQDVAETMRNLEFVFPYRPLKTVKFWLGLGSPIYQNPKYYGIKAVFNHPNWALLFPQHIYQSMRFILQAYRGDLGHQRKIWKPVKRKVEQWAKFYSELHNRPLRLPILSFRDGRDFLIIQQRRAHAESLNHRLVETSRLIYLFCQQHRPFKQIRDQFPSFTEDKLMAFMTMMVDKKLMFEENGKYLSLAVPLKMPTDKF